MSQSIIFANDRLRISRKNPYTIVTILVILPGLDGIGSLHVEFVQALGQSFSSVRVFAYPRDQVMDYAALANLVRQGLPMMSPFILIGESFSGPIAISIAANPPPNLCGLILSTSFAKFPITFAEKLGPLVKFLPVRYTPFFLTSWWLLGPWRTARMEVELKAAIRSVTAAVIQARMVSAICVDVTSLLALVRVPTLYLRARNDRLLLGRPDRLIQVGIVDCTLVEIDGPHLLLQARPQECALAVADFSARIGQSSAIAKV